MKTKLVLGMILFMIFLFISMIEFVAVFAAGVVTTLEQAIVILDTTVKLGLISKILILCMFGVIFLVPEEKI